MLLEQGLSFFVDLSNPNSEDNTVMKNKYDFHVYATEKGFYACLHREEFVLEEDLGPFESVKEADEAAFQAWFDRNKI